MSEHTKASDLPWGSQVSARAQQEAQKAAESGAPPDIIGQSIQSYGDSLARMVRAVYPALNHAMVDRTFEEGVKLTLMGANAAKVNKVTESILEIGNDLSNRSTQYDPKIINKAFNSGVEAIVSGGTKDEVSHVVKTALSPAQPQPQAKLTQFQPGEL